MNLEELKTRLKIKDNSQDSYLTTALEDTIEYASAWCNNPFLDDTGELKLPPSVKKGIALMIDIDQNASNGVLSESIGGMSQTFLVGEAKYEPVFKSWRPFKKLRFV